MTAECLRDAHAAVQGAVEREAHVVHRRDLEHEVVDALALRAADGHRMMARAAVQEGDVDGVSVDVADDAVRQTEAEASP